MYHLSPPIIGRKIRFALIGCGRIAQNHFAAIKHNEDKAELVGICDIDPEALAIGVKKTGAKGYETLTKMLDDCNADVFILTTPSGLHSEQAIQIANAGKHVITEKPMATRWEDGKRMVKACDDAGV